MPLTTGMPSRYEASPGEGKAEAHRKAMLALMDTPVHPEYAHPLFWALVIGNGAYKLAPLTNPLNDSREMTSALQRSGFEVTRLENATREGASEAIERFAGSLQSGSTGVFYYSGHCVSRSEEHTSEHQSPEANSYAVFCLKKNKT